MNGYIYLASPYSDPDAAVRHERYLAVEAAAAQLMREMSWVFSPIIHCHNMAVRYDLPTDATYWWEYDVTMLQSARQLNILLLPGWNISAGVAKEISYAKDFKLPIVYLNPERPF